MLSTSFKQPLICNHFVQQEFYTVTLPNEDKIIFDICQNVTCGNVQSAACWINKSISVGQLWGSRIEHDLDVTILTYP